MGQIIAPTFIASTFVPGGITAAVVEGEWWFA